MFKKSNIIILVAIALLVSVFGLTNYTQAEEKPENAIAKVNGTYITQDRFDRNLARQLERIKAMYQIDFTQEQYKEKFAQLKQQVLNQMVSNEILLETAYEYGIEVTTEEVKAEIDKIKSSYPDEDTFLEMTKQAKYTMEDLRYDIGLQKTYDKLATRLGEDLEISDDEMRTYYENNIDKFSQQEQVKASHILLETEEKAKEILAKLEAGEDFAALAKEFSTGPSGETGGNLGFFGAGKMVPAFEEAAFTMEVGEVSDPVKTRFGYHIIKVTDRKEAIVKEYEDVKSKIKDTLAMKKKADIVVELIKKKSSEADKEFYVDFTAEQSQENAKSETTEDSSDE